MELKTFTPKARDRYQTMKLAGQIKHQDENAALKERVAQLEAEKLKDQERIQHMEAQLNGLRQQIDEAEYQLFDASSAQSLEIKVPAEDIIRPLLAKIDTLEGVFYMLPSDNKVFHNMNTRDYIRALEAFVSVARRYISVEVNGLVVPMPLYDAYRDMWEIGQTPLDSVEKVLVPNPLVPGDYIYRASRNLEREYEDAKGQYISLSQSFFGDPNKRRAQPKKKQVVERPMPQTQPMF